MYGPLIWVLNLIISNLICAVFWNLFKKKKKKGAPLDDDFLGELGLRPCFFFNFD